MESLWCNVDFVDLPLSWKECQELSFLENGYSSEDEEDFQYRKIKLAIKLREWQQKYNPRTHRTYVIDYDMSIKVGQSYVPSLKYGDQLPFTARYKGHMGPVEITKTPEWGGNIHFSYKLSDGTEKHDSMIEWRFRNFYKPKLV